MIFWTSIDFTTWVQVNLELYWRNGAKKQTRMGAKKKKKKEIWWIFNKNFMSFYENRLRKLPDRCHDYTILHALLSLYLKLWVAMQLCFVLHYITCMFKCIMTTWFFPNYCQNGSPIETLTTGMYRFLCFTTFLKYSFPKSGHTKGRP